MKGAQELEGHDLLDALGVEVEEPGLGGYTRKQERILAGHEDVLRFREAHGHASQHGQKLDIFELDCGPDSRSQVRINARDSVLCK